VVLSSVKHGCCAKAVVQKQRAVLHFSAIFLLSDFVVVHVSLLLVLLYMC